MKCPRCDSNNVRLSWLREFSVSYWCPTCHSGFEVNRHQRRATSAARPEKIAALNGVSRMPSAS